MLLINLQRLENKFEVLLRPKKKIEELYTIHNTLYIISNEIDGFTQNN